MSGVVELVWLIGIPIVWWFAVPIIFRWYRDGDDSWDVSWSRFAGGGLGLIAAAFWPLAAVIYLLARVVIWRTQEAS